MALHAAADCAGRSLIERKFSAKIYVSCWAMCRVQAMLSVSGNLGRPRTCMIVLDVRTVVIVKMVSGQLSVGLRKRNATCLNGNSLSQSYLHSTAPVHWTHLSPFKPQV